MRVADPIGFAPTDENWSRQQRRDSGTTSQEGLLGALATSRVDVEAQRAGDGAALAFTRFPVVIENPM